MTLQQRPAHELDSAARRPGVTTVKFASRFGTAESNVYQRTVDYPDQWANGFHVMLDTEWDQVNLVR